MLRTLIFHLVALMAFVPSVFAVIFFATADPAYNTTPPTDALEGSGWDLQGRWGAFLGTPVASNYFITAHHVGGSTNDSLFLGGTTYRVISAHHHPRADLTLWRIDGYFTNFALLFTGTNEIGKPLIVFGRGRTRGEEVFGEGELRGWKWGQLDARLRWGENEVAAITAPDGQPITSTNDLQFLRAVFRTNAGPSEAHLANGDSGGAVFIQEDGLWKLAGINHSVDGMYNTNSVGTAFDAALFDERGLYKGSGTNWIFQRGPEMQPSGFYATRISAYRDWIERVISFGNPFGPISIEFTASLDKEFLPSDSAVVHFDTKTIHLPSTNVANFIRLRSLVPIQINSIRRTESGYILKFDEL